MAALSPACRQKVADLWLPGREWWQSIFALKATAEGGCATRVSRGPDKSTRSAAQGRLCATNANRRRGLLYPIKPEPGLIGAQPASTTIEKATAEGGRAT